MVGSNDILLKKLIESQYVKSVLEIGSGLCSTPIIRNAMKKKNGYCLSIEDKKEWYNKVTQILPNDKFGSVELYSLIWKNNKLIYDFETDKKFDFILIDSPYLDTKTIDKKISQNLFQYLSNHDTHWIETVFKNISKGKGGIASINILEYVKNFSHENTIIMVDRRRSAVYYYLRHYKNIFDFYGWQDGTWNKNTRIDRDITHFKKRYKHIPNHITPGKATIICFKGNTIIEKICKEKSITLYNYLKE